MTKEADELKAATDNALKLLADVRGATKDLRQAMKEHRETIPMIVREELAREVEKELNVLKDEPKAATAKAVAGVFKRFDELTDLLMKGTRADRRQGKLDIDALIRNVAMSGDFVPAPTEDKG